MLWIFVAAYDYQVGATAHLTFDALIDAISEAFVSNDPSAPLDVRVRDVLTSDPDFHDARVEAVDPATGHAVSLDIDTVVAGQASAHARRALVRQVESELACSPG